jgi:hypothetical protein
LRTSINNWIRSVPSPLAGIIDADDAATDGRRDGKWAPNYMNSSGAQLHPGATGSAGMETYLQAAYPTPFNLPAGV